MNPPEDPPKPLDRLLWWFVRYHFPITGLLILALIVAMYAAFAKQNRPYAACVEAGGVVSYGSQGHDFCTPPAGRRFDP